MCNIHEHAVLTDILEPNGSSFVGKHGDDFMPTNDMAWVGFSVEIGPEGGVYILDWHDTDVCGTQLTSRIAVASIAFCLQVQNPSPHRNLTALSDSELVDLQTHNNDWYVRHARTLLQSRSHLGLLDMPKREATASADAATRVDEPETPASFVGTTRDWGNGPRTAWRGLLQHEDEHIRAWAVQLLCDSSPINAFQDASQANASVVSDSILQKLSTMARVDPSPVVRLQLASAVQRLAYKDRWDILAVCSRAPKTWMTRTFRG